MAEKLICNGSEIETRTRNTPKTDMYDDLTMSTNTSMLIINLCNDIAKKIKDQVVDVIGHVALETSSKA